VRGRLAVLVAAAALIAAPAAVAATLPAGFTEDTLFSGLTAPTVVRFAPDGRVFVAEKAGLVKVFDGPGDSTPSVVADLRTNVHDPIERGLLGLALDPGFPANPYLYVLYTYDHVLGSADPPPRWGAPGGTDDPCPSPSGAHADGCVASARLSRLRLGPDGTAGPEQVLVEDWCSQYPSHSIGALAFGPDGALYASAGDAASASFTDYGQRGTPRNPCGDPPRPPGTALAPPSAEGGSLRAQDLRTPADPVTLDGTIIRVDPATGDGLPGNPLAGSSDPNARRIVAHGLRNPFRIAFRPGTSELWLGDVGWGRWEEIDRIPDAGASGVMNFGWPCYEGGAGGNARQPAWAALGLGLCEDLYADPAAVTAPFAAYRHDGPVAGESCPAAASALSGLAFAPAGGGPYPADDDGALFVADYARDCVWVMKRGAGGLPDPTRLEPFVQDAANPVDLETTPQGELVYVDLDGGTIRRIRFGTGAAPAAPGGSGAGPAAPAAEPEAAEPDAPPLPPAGGAPARVPPAVRLAAPAPALRWRVGERIRFAGGATDRQDGVLPASALSWSLLVRGCLAVCQSVPLRQWPGVASGSFRAPAHAWPAHLELRLTATDRGGLTATRTLRLDPATATVRLRASVPGLRLRLDRARPRSPVARTVIAGSVATVAAPAVQRGRRGTGRRYRFCGWSDGRPRAHRVTVRHDATLVARYARRRHDGGAARCPRPDGRPR